MENQLAQLNSLQLSNHATTIKELTCFVMIISSATQVSVKDSAFNSALETCFLEFIHPENMKSIWMSLLRSLPAQRKCCLQQFLSMHRLMCNYSQLDSIVTADTYCLHVVDGYLMCMNEIGIAQSHFTHVFNSLPTSYQTEFVLRSSRSEYSAMVSNSVDCDVALNMAVVTLKLVTHSKLNWDKAKDYFTCLVLRSAINVENHVEIVTQLLTKQPFDHVVPKIVIDLLPIASVLEALEYLGLIWGDKKFIAKGRLIMQSYLTAAIICGLSRVMQAREQTAEDNDTYMDESKSYLAALCVGVSGYLDSSDKVSRVCGMHVAQALAKHMGKEIHFDELNSGNECAMGDALGGVVAGMSDTFPSMNASTTCRTQNTADCERASEGDASASDDSDSELEGYNVDELANSKYLQHSAVYLRHCLHFLQNKKEDDPKAFENHQKALTSIPQIVKTCPVDARDTVGPLVHELIRLSNSFNLENFEAVRDEAILSLLSSYPALAAPVMVFALDTPEVTMLGARLTIIAAMSRAACVLADRSHHQASDKPAGLDNIQNDSASLRSVGDDDDVEMTMHLVDSKTRIKRPVKLAQLHRTTRFYRNNFAPVAPLFFYPMLRVLGQYQQTTNSQGLVLVRSSLTSSSSSSLRVSDDIDGIDQLLPAKALFALAVFTSCSINTVHQKSFTENALKAAVLFRASPSLTIRRAALTVMLACVEAWKQFSSSQQSSASLTNSQHNNTIMQSLTNVLDNESSQESSARDMIMQESIAGIMDWIVSTGSTDADAQSRVLKANILKCAVELF